MTNEIIDCHGKYEAHPSNDDQTWAVVNSETGIVRSEGMERDEAVEYATELNRDEIIEAVTAADLCCPEQVCDAVVAVADAGGDWRAELARAKANDAAERSALGIDE